MKLITPHRLLPGLIALACVAAGNKLAHHPAPALLQPATITPSASDAMLTTHLFRHNKTSPLMPHR
jgi:hypothetical protein